MRPAEGWKDYELLDASGGERLERWGGGILIRPDPQVIWHTERRAPGWEAADAVYHRSDSGGGSWEIRNPLPVRWTANWNDAVRLYVSLTAFKHTGVFPEQAANWKLYLEIIKSAARPVNVLNLFGYTGGATIACLAAGSAVCHVDASRGMLEQAKRNAALSGLRDKPARYIADDCMKFVKREARRGVKYDAVIMDPPSYGRGPSGEVWKLEDDIYSLVMASRDVLAEKPLFFVINSYTAGISPAVMGYMLSSVLSSYGGTVSSGEIGLTVKSSGFVLPAGGTAVFSQ